MTRLSPSLLLVATFVLASCAIDAARDERSASGKHICGAQRSGKPGGK